MDKSDKPEMVQGWSESDGIKISNLVVPIDFSDHQELAKALVAEAKEELRDLDNQIIWILRQHFNLTKVFIDPNKERLAEILATQVGFIRPKSIHDMLGEPDEK